MSLPRPRDISTVPAPIDAYRDHGNRRPSPDALDSVCRYITSQSCASTSSRLVLADSRIDQAMVAVDESSHRLEQARDTLDGIIEEIESLDPAGQNFARQTPDLVSAYVRRSELTNWSRVAQGLAPTPNYDNLLTAASEVASLGKYDQLARSRIIEFLPVLLGARGLHRGSPQGWVGRLALNREDHRSLMAPDANTNWDFGVCQTSDPSSYDNPEIRIDMKTDRVRREIKERHAAVGIGTLSASSCGISNPELIIWSCVNEMDGGVPDGVGIILLSSEQLDERTARVDAGIQELANVLAGR